MDIIAYFLRWEDKYWGLFLTALLLFAAGALGLYEDKKQDARKQDASRRTDRNTDQKTGQKPDLKREQKTDQNTDQMSKRRYLSLVIYGLAGYLILLCPLVYRAASAAGFSDSAYERLFHIWQYPIILPAAGALVASLCLRQGEKLRAAALLSGFVVLFFIAGDAALISPKAEYISVDLVSKEARMSYDMILEDAEENGMDPLIWGPSEWMAKSLIYSGKFTPSYGKDIAAAPENYNETQKIMKSGYDGFENAESPRVNMEDQIGAIANLPNVMADAPVRYVALIDPASLESNASVDADAIFAGCGYTLIGTADALRIYRYDGQGGE